MSLDDLSDTLKDLAIRVVLVQLPAVEEQRVRELVKELKAMLDAVKAKDHKPILWAATAVSMCWRRAARAAGGKVLRCE
jgi:hypothetical protein